MGFYTRYMLPWGMDKLMSKPTYQNLRQETLASARGMVLEIGFGTGLNLPHYDPSKVEKLISVDVNPGMNRRAQQRIDASPIPVDARVLSAETLPLEDASIDTVTSTWTLCSIADVDQALREIHRVLNCDGRFLFLEHGASPHTRIRRWQNRLNPLQKLWGGGCNLNRDMKSVITCAGFTIEALDNFYTDNEPKCMGYMYQGVAVPTTR